MIGRRVAHCGILEKPGMVYRAHDLHLERFVTSGVLPPEEVCGGRGIRVFCWEQAPGRLRAGLGFFGREGDALPVITVYDKFARH